MNENGRTQIESAPPSPAPNTAVTARRMLVWASTSENMTRDVSACRASGASGSPQPFNICAHRIRAARNFARVANMSCDADKRQADRPGNWCLPEIPACAIVSMLLPVLRPVPRIGQSLSMKRPAIGLHKWTDETLLPECPSQVRILNTEINVSRTGRWAGLNHCTNGFGAQSPASLRMANFVQRQVHATRRRIRST